MAKGSGTTKGGTKSNPKGLATASVSVVERALNIAEKSPFVANKAAGEWKLETPLMSALVTKEVDEYGETHYDVSILDKNGRPNATVDTEQHATLNGAKAIARDLLYYLIDREND